MAFGVAQTNMDDQEFGILNTLSGSAKAGQQAMDFANQLYPQVAEADPWEAAFQFFSEMGRQASQPGATVLGSAVGSMQVPMDYLAAKKKEKTETDRARIQTAVQIAPSLKPKPKTGSTTAVKVVGPDGKPIFMSTSEAIRTGAEPYEKPSDKTSTFKERKFYKTGLPAAVVKNETDAALFESNGWSAVPPEGWSESVDADGFETQTSQILDGGLIVFAGKDGTSKVVRAGTNEEVTGDEALTAIAEAEDRGIQIQRQRAGGRRAGVIAVNTSLSAFDRVAKSRSNIANLEEAKRLVLEEGANTGAIADRLPNWKASSVALETVKNELGLDVVGAVTFGALSKGELDLALNTALPTNLSEDALVDWIDRKIAAQRKLQDYLYDQARFLARGEKTIGDWLDEAEAEKEKRERIAAARAQAGTNFDFPTMTESDILEVDIDALDSAQFDAFEKRMKELGLY